MYQPSEISASGEEDSWELTDNIDIALHHGTGQAKTSNETADGKKPFLTLHIMRFSYERCLSPWRQCFRCTYAEKYECEETFETQKDASCHVILVHNVAAVHRQRMVDSYARWLRSLAVQQYSTSLRLFRSTWNLYTQGKDSLVRLQRSIAVHQRSSLSRVRGCMLRPKRRTVLLHSKVRVRHAPMWKKYTIKEVFRAHLQTKRTATKRLAVLPVLLTMQTRYTENCDIIVHLLRSTIVLNSSADQEMPAFTLNHTLKSSTYVLLQKITSVRRFSRVKEVPKTMWKVILTLFSACVKVAMHDSQPPRITWSMQTIKTTPFKMSSCVHFPCAWTLWPAKDWPNRA